MSEKKSPAFTLIELLIVSVIIALLSVVVMINLGISKQKTRDNQRKADLSKIGSALEAYYADNKSYPSTITISGGLPNYVEIDLSSVPLNVLVETGMGVTSKGYLDNIPIVDPLNDTDHKYKYISNGYQYKLFASQAETIKSSDSETIKRQKAGVFFDPNHPLQLQISSSQDALNNY